MFSDWELLWPRITSSSFSVRIHHKRQPTYDRCNLVSRAMQAVYLKILASSREVYSSWKDWYYSSSSTITPLEFQLIRTWFHVCVCFMLFQRWPGIRRKSRIFHQERVTPLEISPPTIRFAKTTEQCGNQAVELFDDVFTSSLARITNVPYIAFACNASIKTQESNANRPERFAASINN